MVERTVIPKISIHPQYLVLYNEYQNCSSYYSNSDLKPILPESTDTQGLISKKASNKIKKGINWLLVLAQDKKVFNAKKGKEYKFKIAFVTLTLSSQQVHLDNEIKGKCLNQFLIESKKKWGVTHYLWRAEAQENGNIHFHILVDKFIPWSELRDTWNRIQNKLSYVDRYRAEMKRFHAGGFQVRKDLLKKWSYKSQIKAYKTGSKNDWNSPNSTDVHSITLISNLPAYLAKYCTKNKENNEIKGKLWGLSRSLSTIRGASDDIDSQYTDELINLEKIEGINTFYSDYFTVIFVSAEMLEVYGCHLLHTLFCSTVEQYRKFYN